MKKSLQFFLILTIVSSITDCNHQKDSIENTTSYKKEGQSMLSLEDIISNKPKNAAYHKTILQSYPSGGESRWDIFYDRYDNEICNICTSDILGHPNVDFATSKDSPFLTDTIYVYNEDGTIAKRTVSFMDSVRESRFEYNSNKTISRELQFENGVGGTSLSYEYDDHDNPVKVYHIVDGDIIYTDEYEYTYDVNGRISYKLWKSRLYVEQIYNYWFEYDERGNITNKKEFREGADFPSYEKNYYDENNHLIRSESYIGDQLLSESIFEYEFYDR